MVKIVDSNNNAGVLAFHEITGRYYLCEPNYDYYLCDSS
ncbi:hypothetical protein SPFM12_00284 [Salmonella phage SPFM12]|nr:hypothetical protein SPFM12_00284 [Salmonella phage SPFM12]